MENAAGPACRHQAAGVVAGLLRGRPVVQVERHGDDLRLELRGAGAHVPLEDVDVGEEAEGFVHEVVVVVVAAVHGARALARLPEGVLLRCHGAELGEDLVPAHALLREHAIDGEAVGIGVVAHRMLPPGDGSRRWDRRLSDQRLCIGVNLANTPVGDNGACAAPGPSSRCTATSAPGSAGTWWGASCSWSSPFPSSWPRPAWPACRPSRASTPSWPERSSSRSSAPTPRCRSVPTRPSRRCSPPGWPPSR